MVYATKINSNHRVGEGETASRPLLHTIIKVGIDRYDGMDEGETGDYVMESYVAPNESSVDWSGHSGHSGHGHILSALAYYCENVASGTAHSTADAVSGSGGFGETQTSVGTHGHYASLFDIFTFKPHCKTDDDHTGIKLAIGAIVDESVRGTTSEADLKLGLPNSSSWVDVSPCAHFTLPAAMDLKGEGEAVLGSTDLTSHEIETEAVKIVITALNAYEQKCSSHAECFHIDLADGEMLAIKPVFAVLKEIGAKSDVSMPGNPGEEPDVPSSPVEFAVAFINHKVNISELIRCNKSDKLLDKIMILLTHKAKAAIE